MKKLKHILANFILELRTMIVNVVHKISDILVQLEMNLRINAINGKNNVNGRQKKSKSKNSKYYKCKRS